MKVSISLKAPKARAEQLWVALDRPGSTPFIPEAAKRALISRLKGGGNPKHLAAAQIDLFESGSRISAMVVAWEEKKRSYFDQVQSYRKFGALISAAAASAQADEIVLDAATLQLDTPEHVYALYEGLLLARYRFDQLKSKKKKPPTRLRNLILVGARAKLDLTFPEAAVAATVLARDLINLPPNHCTPTFLANEAKRIARQGKLQCKIFGTRELQRIGANLLLAVAAGSKEQPCLIKLTYRPRRTKQAHKVIGLVGKGVTFDSGGLCIKTMAGMSSQKSDMSGAAAVMAVMQAIGNLEPDVEVRAYMACTENMPGGRAMRVGDVVTGLAGKSVEILNTDAEGRLVLADALAMASNDGCDVIIDLATLTGANVVALGGEYAGLFATSDELARDLMRASEQAGERLWRMPLPEEYRHLLTSSVADFKNTFGPNGGSITAALFLTEFAKVKAYAHLDIAGLAFGDSERGFIKKGGVGFGVRTLLNFVAAA